MMRPFEELLAYYRFIQQNGPRKRRPKLSDEAKAMAKIFEKLMRKADYFQKLSDLFHDDVSAEELNELIEVYQQSLIEHNVLLDNKVMEPLDIDLVFEKKVSSFMRLQERGELRKRFQALEEYETLMEKKMVDHLVPKRSEPTPENKPIQWPVFVQWVFGMIVFYLLVYLIKWLAHL
jgi:hypothetical protein